MKAANDRGTGLPQQHTAGNEPAAGIFQKSSVPGIAGLFLGDLPVRESTGKLSHYGALYCLAGRIVGVELRSGSYGPSRLRCATPWQVRPLHPACLGVALAKTDYERSALQAVPIRGGFSSERLIKVPRYIDAMPAVLCAVTIGQQRYAADRQANTGRLRDDSRPATKMT